VGRFRSGGDGDGLAAFVLKAELSTGCVDIGTFAFANSGGDSGGFEDTDEFAFSFFGRFGEGGFFDAIHGDEIDVGAASGEEPGEQAGVFRGIVFAADEDVFVGDAAAADVEVVVGRLEDFLDADVFIDGDQLGAELIVGCVERDGEVVGFTNAGEFSDFLGESNGGDGDASHAHAEAPFFDDVIEGGEEIGEVGERFADAHDDDVGEAFVGGEEAVESEYLLEDFAGGEAAFDAQ